MLINSIEMTYFFRIYQSQKLDFSSDLEKNVTVIRGDNGTGKTTMLSAFSWVFYGMVEEPLVIDGMLNKRRLYEMANDDIETASVKISITDNKHEYILSRSQKFKKTGDNNAVRVGDPDFSVIDVADPSHPIQNKKFFESIIPKDLKGFFFFDGERIDRLAKIDGKSEIKKAILDVLGLTTLEKIDEGIAAVQSDYIKNVKKASKSEVVQQLTQDFEDTEAAISADKESLVAVKEKRIEAEKSLDAASRFLKEHNAEAVKALQIQRDILNNEKLQIEDSLARIKQEILRFTTKNFKYYLIKDRFQEISDFLEEKRKKKELPSDIKRQFVHDLLCSGECICGQKLEEGSSFYESISRLLETAGREELDNAYITMRAFVDSEEVANNNRIFFDKMNEYSNDVLNYNVRLEEISKNLGEIKKKLSNDYGDLIATYEGQLEQAQQIRDNCLIEENQLDLTIKSNELKKKSIESKLKFEKGKQENKNMFSDAFDLASQLRNLNDEIRQLFITITREDMDEKIKSVFESISRKEDREACLSEDFELTIRNKSSHKVQVLSTGERQITSLSFIGALVSYAREKSTSDLITDFSGGDFPIVMDSPFGNLSGIHKANVAKGLPLLASQIIVIVSDEQWQGTVEENLAERVKQVYVMRDGNYEGKDDEYTEFVM